MPRKSKQITIMKTIVLILYLLCMSVCTYAQNTEALAKSDSLFAKGVELYNHQKFEEAIPLFTESDKIDKAELDETSNRREYSSMWLASCYFKLNELETAESISPDYNLQPVDRRLTVQSDSLSALGIQVYTEGRPHEALQLLNEAARLESKNLGSNHPFYGNTLSIITNILANLGAVEESLEVLNEWERVVKLNYGTESSKYGNILSTKGLIFHATQTPKAIIQAIEAREKAFEIFKSHQETQSLQWEAYFLANEYMTIGDQTEDLDQSIDYYKKGLIFIPYIGDVYDTSEIYSYLSRRLGLSYVNFDIKQDLLSSNPKESIRINSEGIKYLENAISAGDNSCNLTLSAAYSRLGSAYQRLNITSQAIQCMEKSLSILKFMDGVDVKYLTYPILSLVGLYTSSIQPDKAFELLQEAKSLFEDGLIGDSYETLNFYLSGSQMLAQLNRNIDAREYIDKASKIAVKLYDPDSTEYTDFLAGRAKVYMDLNDEIACLNDLKTLRELVPKLFPGNERAQLNILQKELRAKKYFGDESWENTYLNILSKLQDSVYSNPIYLINIYATAAEAYSNMSDYTKALETINKAIELYTPIASQNIDYLQELKYIKLNNYVAASIIPEGLAFCDEIIATPSETFFMGKVYQAQSALFYKNGDIDGAIESIQRAIECRLAISKDGDTSGLYNFLSTQAGYYEAKKDYQKAAELRRQVMDIVYANTGKDSEQYLHAVVDLESIPTIGDGERLKQAQLRLLNHVKETHGATSLSYYINLMETAKIYLNLGLFKEAVEMGKSAIDGKIKILGEKNESIQADMITLASLYIKTGDYDNAFIYLDRAHQLTVEHHPSKIYRLQNASNWKWDAYINQLDFGSALYQIDLNIKEAIANFGENSYEHISSLINKALILFRIGDYIANEKLCREIITRSESGLHGQVQIEAIKSAKNSLSMALAALGHYDEAINVGKEIVDMGIDTNDIPIFYHNFAYTNFMAGEKEKAIELSLKIPFETNSSSSVDLSSIYVKQGFIRALSGAEEEGIGLMERGLAMRDSIFGGEGYYVTLGLQDLVKVHDALNNPDKRNVYALRLSKVARDYILKSFLTMHSNGRQALWNRYSNFFLNDFPSFTAVSQTDEMVQTAYNNALLGKGLLLSTDRSISELLSSSSDPLILDKYNTYKRNLQLLDFIHTADRSKIVVNIDSIVSATRQLEYEILNQCEDFTSALNIKWQDVRDGLKQNEVAVEFCTIGNESDKFLALILKKGSSMPQALVLNDVDATSLWNINPRLLSEKLWKPLANSIGNAKTIYFSPSGALHNIPIELLPDYSDDGTLINNRWELHRLSSTKMIADNHNNTDIKNVTLYGGLAYDATMQSMADDAEKYASSQTRDFALFNLIDSLNLRSGVSNLPQTKVEVENVSQLLRKQNIQPNIFTDLSGTEASFKNLSGGNTNLLHIATHGFYWTESEARRAGVLKFLINSDDNIQLSEDKAMTRSGLLLAGANNALMGKRLPENTEDGILTSKEIANLDFSKLDLLVMSACQTGLGEITGEGVFGLQRGFKKAGANSLLMSLWKVDDRATQMLMTKFYEHFLSGKSKLESLTLAQQYIREFEEEVIADGDSVLTASQKRRKEMQNENVEVATYEKVKIRPFADPKYWAAFILLDAID